MKPIKVRQYVLQILAQPTSDVAEEVVMLVLEVVDILDSIEDKTDGVSVVFWGKSYHIPKESAIVPQIRAYGVGQEILENYSVLTIEIAVYSSLVD